MKQQIMKCFERTVLYTVYGNNHTLDRITYELLGHNITPSWIYSAISRLLDKSELLVMDTALGMIYHITDKGQKRIS